MRNLLILAVCLLACRGFSQNCSQLKYLRINVHFMLKSDGTGNFNELGNNLPSNKPEHSGYKFAQMMVDNANVVLQSNSKLNIPIGNTYINEPIPFRYVLSGVYFHRDDRFYTLMINKSEIDDMNIVYGVNRDKELNVFLTDAFYSYGGVDLMGAANGNTCNSGAVNMANGWHDYITGHFPGSPQTFPVPAAYGLHKLLNHEVGHLLSLKHPFEAENCSDTEYNDKWCNEAIQSNNVMDYNCEQSAWSPCQLSNVRAELSGAGVAYWTCSTNQPVSAMFSIPHGSACVNQPIVLRGSWRNLSNRKETSYRISIYETTQIGTTDVKGKSWQSVWYQGTYGDITLNSIYPYAFTEGVYIVSLEAQNATTSHKVSQQLVVTTPTQAPMILNPYSVAGTVNFLSYNSIDFKNFTGTATGRGTFKSNRYINLEDVSQSALGAVLTFEIPTDMECSSPNRPNNFRLEDVEADQPKVPSGIVPHVCTMGEKKAIGEEDETISYLNVSPIPTSERLHIEAQQPMQSLFLYNELGVLVLYRELKGVKVHDLDIRTLPSGFYNLKINMESNKVKVAKVVITH